MITLPALQITPPSDFKIKLTSVKRQDGTDVDVTTTFIGFSFFVEGDRYDCISDPLGNTSQNTVIDDGYLYLIFEDYPFKYGRLRYVQHERFADTMYTDDVADYYSRLEDTNLFFTR